MNRSGLMRTMGRALLLPLAMAVVSLCWAAPAEAGSDLRIAVTDIVGKQDLVADFEPFAEELGRILGRTVTLVPVRGRIDAVRLMRQRKVDFVFTGPAEYVVIRKLTNARPVIGLHRVDYHCLIVTPAASPYKSLKDLVGQKVVLGSVGSTSAHLAPMQLLADNGVDPVKDVRTVHAELLKAWRAMLRGSVAAAAYSSSKYPRLRQMERERSGTRFRVLGRGPDLPGDVLVAAPHVTDIWVSDIRRAFGEHEDELRTALLEGRGNAKYKGALFSVDVKDEDYEAIRTMYATAGFPAYSTFIGD